MLGDISVNTVIVINLLNQFSNSVHHNKGDNTTFTCKNAPPNFTWFVKCEWQHSLRLVQINLCIIQL